MTFLVPFSGVPVIANDDSLRFPNREPVHCCAFYSSDDELRRLLNAILDLDFACSAEHVVIVDDDDDDDDDGDNDNAVHHVTFTEAEHARQSSRPPVLRLAKAGELRSLPIFGRVCVVRCGGSCSGQPLVVDDSKVVLTGIICLFDLRSAATDALLGELCSHPLVALISSSTPPGVELVDNACLVKEPRPPLNDSILACWLANLREQNVAASGSQASFRLMVRDHLLAIRYNQKLTDAVREAQASADRDNKLLERCLMQIREATQSIGGALDLLQETSLSTDQRELLHLIRISSEHLVTIATRNQHSRRCYQSFDVGVMLQAALALFSPAAAAKNQSLRLAVGTATVWLRGDVTHLTQIVHNLLSNAIKYTGTGGCIELRSEWRAPGDADVQGVLTIGVADSGIGIDDSHLERIFERFLQVDATSAGAGLGLCICRQLAQEMGGTLSVVSQLGVGSKFTLAVPMEPVPSGGNADADIDARRTGHSEELAAEVAAFELEPSSSLSPASSVSSSASPQHCTRQLRILIAEPVLETRAVLSGLLQELGLHSIYMCSDGFRAVEIALQQSFDICLIGGAVPTVSACDAARLIRRAYSEFAGLASPRILVLLTDKLPDEGVAVAPPGVFDGQLRVPCTLQEVAEGLNLL